MQFRTQAGIAAFGIVLLLALGVFLTILIAGQGSTQHGSGPLGEDKPTRPTKLTKAEERSTVNPLTVDGDPWPECKAVREYLATNLNDPSGLEIVSWEGQHRAAADNQFFKAGTLLVYVKFRAKNQYGSMQLEHWQFAFDGNKVISAGSMK